ncbi:BLUF domain-containing protein [Flavimarina sp. Hel_I_48]|uniref:BLUF domain-containing protein n=1 Tax=Flavimarina sp. Hel_I_48 TaxID=1392488 RepID=UPI0004DEEF74|nr:BLUF domain-containing protein [Flavimarina sp. Hel_I_48]
MKLPHTICYISKSIKSLTHEDIQDILEHAEATNTECKVSGVLLHSMGNFFQVLEGGKEHITALYNKILKDPRHTDVFEVYNHPSAKPVFLDYQSNFHVVKDNERLEWIRKYLVQNRSSETSAKLTRLLRPFIFFE